MRIYKFINYYNRKTQALASQPDYDTDDSSSDLDTQDFGQLDDLDTEPTEEDESIAMMIQVRFVFVFLSFCFLFFYLSIFILILCY